MHTGTFSASFPSIANQGGTSYLVLCCMLLHEIYTKSWENTLFVVCLFVCCLFVFVCFLFVCLFFVCSFQRKNSETTGEAFEGLAARQTGTESDSLPGGSETGRQGEGPVQAVLLLPREREGCPGDW